jgi:hypothetical protein
MIYRMRLGSCTAWVSSGRRRGGTKQREQNETNASNRDENRRSFESRMIALLVRDEGVAGSNPATPINT